MLNPKALAAITVLLSNARVALGQSGIWGQCKLPGQKEEAVKIDSFQVVVLDGLDPRLMLRDLCAHIISILPQHISIK